MGHLFEQYIGLELIRLARMSPAVTSIKFWRDPGGPEVDWIIEQNHSYVPIEVKWTKTPSLKDTKGLNIFLKEYRSKTGYIVCQTPRKVKLSDNIYAIPWESIHSLIK